MLLRPPAARESERGQSTSDEAQSTEINRGSRRRVELRPCSGRTSGLTDGRAARDERARARVTGGFIALGKKCDALTDQAEGRHRGMVTSRETFPLNYGAQAFSNIHRLRFPPFFLSASLASFQLLPPPFASPFSAPTGLPPFLPG